jgi:hypothetical protein
MGMNNIPQEYEFVIKWAQANLQAQEELESGDDRVFTTIDERAAFFADLRQTPESVEYGTALTHARSYMPGLWDQKEVFYRDCAEIMAFELRKYQSEQGYEQDITAEEVIASPSFRQTFESSSKPKSIALDAFVRSLSNSDSVREGAQPIPEMPHLYPSQKEDTSIHEFLIQEIRAA